MIGIYKITNKVNGKVYIGQSINIEKRVHEHFYKSLYSNDVSFTSILHTAIRKYGAENFEWEILIECKCDELDSFERYYINNHNSITPNGYNVAPGGQKVKAMPLFCLDCGKQITKHSKSGLCKICKARHTRKAIRPDKDTLKKEVLEFGYSGTGRKHGVSYNAIKKWLKSM